MDKQEREAKEKEARPLLERNGYSDEEIESIFQYAFGDKKEITGDDSQD